MSSYLFLWMALWCGLVHSESAMSVEELDEEQLITIPLISFVVLEVLTLLFGICFCASIIGGAMQFQIIYDNMIDKTKRYSGFKTLSDKHMQSATETELD